MVGSLLHHLTGSMLPSAALFLSLPHAQDGVAIKHSERIAANQALPELEKQLHDELIAMGLDPTTVRPGAFGVCAGCERSG